MAAERITISIDAGLAAELRAAAADDNANVSTFASEAIRRALNGRGLRSVITEWEAEHGVITDAELEQARQDLGW